MTLEEFFHQYPEVAVAFSGGAVTAAGLYECMLFLLTGVQWLFLSLFLPGIQICFLLMLAGHMVKEDMLSRFRDLVGTGISWGVKTLMGLVVGFHLLQGLVLPYADAVKNSGLIRVMEVIPGIGGGAKAQWKEPINRQRMTVNNRAMAAGEMVWA